MTSTATHHPVHPVRPVALAGPGAGSDGVHHFEADLTFGGCGDPRCATGSVEPTVDMS